MIINCPVDIGDKVWILKTDYSHVECPHCNLTKRKYRRTPIEAEIINFTYSGKNKFYSYHVLTKDRPTGYFVSDIYLTKCEAEAAIK